MDKVYIADFNKESREELIVLVFEAYYPNNKLTYNENFIKSCIQESEFMREIYQKEAVNPFNFDKEFGIGTLQDLVETLRENKPKNIDILESLNKMELN